MRVLKALVGVLLAGGLWSAIYIAGILEGWWRTPIASEGDVEGFTAALEAELEARFKGNAAYILIEAGKPVRSRYLSIGKPVDDNSVFQVASLSKWVLAHGVMMLVEDGTLELDRPVSDYLTRWQLPESDFDNGKVTVRRLLSHTAGLTDGLGYNGFEPGEPVQSLEASLTHAADASPGADGRTRVGVEPGTKWQYSGGGFTLLQLLIEEVSGQGFEDFMEERLFHPLGMTQSSFALESAEGPDVVDFYDTDGSLATHYRFTGRGAAGLYVSAGDMARLVSLYTPGPKGEPIGRGLLRPETLKKMRQPEARLYGADIWGLGTILYVPLRGGDNLIGHDGNNFPAINTTARVNPVTGDGIVIFVTGNTLLATELGGDWSFWQAGKPDLLDVMMGARQMVVILGVGWAVILVLGVLLLWVRRR